MILSSPATFLERLVDGMDGWEVKDNMSSESPVLPGILEEQDMSVDTRNTTRFPYGSRLIPVVP